MTKTFFGSKSRQFMDPVHGGIGALPHEVACIDHLLFQRLRYIRQNDVAQYVFSGATQTRFNHSIGVMHVAGKFFRALIEQYCAESQSDFRISDKHTDAVYYVYACFRLAALLHDTGHFPFSHEFEKTPRIHSLLESSDVLKDFWGRSSLHQKYAARRLGENDFVASHEDYSLAIAFKVLSSVAEAGALPVEVDDVLALMEGHSHCPTAKWLDACGNLFEVFEGKASTRANFSEAFIADKTRQFFAQMISGELDVDKMDYMLRDSYFSGAKYGIYNLDHLLSTLRIGFNPDTQWVGLAILEKGVVALEDFVYSRFQIYQNMWSHKSVVGSKLLLAAAIDEALDPGVIAEVKTYLSSDHAFCFFTDDYFLEKFRANALRANAPSAIAFLSRKKHRYLDRLVDAGRDSIAEREIALAKNCRGKVIHRKVNITFSKIRDKEFSSIKVITRGTGGKRQLKQLQDESGFFSKFTEKLIVNFYESGAR